MTSKRSSQRLKGSGEAHRLAWRKLHSLADLGLDGPILASVVEVADHETGGQSAVDLDAVVAAGLGALDDLGSRCRCLRCGSSSRRAGESARATAWPGCRPPGRWSRPRSRSAGCARGGAASISLGSRSVRSSSKGRPSRKKLVSLMVMASAMERSSAGFFACLEVLDKLLEARHALVAQELGRGACRRDSRATDRARFARARRRAGEDSRSRRWRRSASLDHRSPKLAGFRVRPAGKPEDFRNDGVERKHLVRQSCVGDRAGHSPDRAGGLVLSQHAAAVVADDAATQHSVGAHAGQHHGQGARRR